MYKNKEKNIFKNAFTIAEILITIAILGIVAVLTIPSLIGKYKEKETIVSLKKAYNIINQAYQLALLENGELYTWGFPGNATNSSDEEENETWNSAATINMKLFWSKLTPFMKTTSICHAFEDSACQSYTAMYTLDGTSKNFTSQKFHQLTTVNLIDGSNFLGGWISNINCTNKTSCGDLAVDINGINQPPNTIGRDIFYFTIRANNIIPMGKDTARTFEANCKRKLTGDLANGYGCTAWVIENENLDYLKCDDLSWTGKHKCSK